MRLTLVERQEPRLRCAPDLGIAYLLGQCKENNVDASLVQGTPNTLDCLLDESVFELYLKEYKRYVDDNGEPWLKEFLGFSHSMATSNNIWDKTNPEAMGDLWDLMTFTRDKVWPKWLPDFLFNQIKKTKPDVVGFSLWDFYDNPQISKAISAIIERLKQESGVRVLAGGPGTVTKTARRDVLKMFKPDIIVHHEGELALFDALDMLESSKYKEGENITFKGYDGESKPIEDLDSLALPDFSQYDLDSFFLPKRVLPIMTSRGCPWAACAFCNHHATYKGYRELDVDRIVETIERYKKDYKADMIMLHDETFTSERARQIIDEFPEAYYYSYAYPKGFDRPLLKKMYGKGFRVLVWGVESGCQRTLNSMRKGTDIKEVGQIIRDSHSVGITNVAFIMFGFPGETEEQAQETVEFLARNSSSIERHATTAFRVEENSPIWENPRLWGVKLKKNGYSVNSGMGQKETKKFLGSLNKRDIKTAANTKYYIPGDSEFRAYFFMQVVYGEGSGEYPVRSGILSGDMIWPSFMLKDVSRPVLQLTESQKTSYEKCDGSHRVDASEFEKYPYVVYYERSFSHSSK